MNLFEDDEILEKYRETIKEKYPINSLYKDSSEVRRKLGMAENDTNLSIFLQDLLKMKIVK